jgi:hypothetical protein
VTYRLRYPDAAEAAEIETELLNEARSHGGQDENYRRQFRQTVIEYQTAKGLAADGIFGKNTARALSQEWTLLEVEALTSEILYPPVPRHAFFVVDFQTVERNPERFYRGFESLGEVMRHDLPEGSLKEAAKLGTKFVVFVYFFDRVDPTLPISLTFSDVPKRRTETMSSVYYADPQTWPVFVENINIEGKLGFSRLYANLFIGDQYVSSHRLN